MPDGFPYDSGWYWLKNLGFGEQAAKRIEEQRQQEEQKKQKEVDAVSMGFQDANSLDRALRFSALPPEEQERILAERENPKSKDLPDQESANPTRRAERVGEKAKDAPGRDKEKRLRSVSVGLGDVKDQSEQYLRHQYTNPNGEMICQICQATLPFKLDGGAYYFEKVEFLDDLRKRHYQSYLALCPNHSAMFQYANTSQPKLKELFSAMTGQRMDVVLAQTNFSIYFTKVHIADLKKVIEVDAAQEGASAAPVPQIITNISTTTLPARPLPNGLVQCPHCPSPVRPDRLEAHIARLHTGRPSTPRNQPHPPKRTPSGSSGSSIHRCPCGKPAIPGDDYCYSCRTD